MNPLKQSQRQTLKKLDCVDLADKVDEIVDWITENNKEKKELIEVYAENFQDNPEEIIKWAENEIKEYKKLIKLLKK